MIKWCLYVDKQLFQVHSVTFIAIAMPAITDCRPRWIEADHSGNDLIQ